MALQSGSQLITTPQKPVALAPAKSTYVPQHLAALVGGGGNGPSVTNSAKLNKPATNTAANFAPASSVPSAAAAPVVAAPSTSSALANSNINRGLLNAAGIAYAPVGQPATPTVATPNTSSGTNSSPSQFASTKLTVGGTTVPVYSYQGQQWITAQDAEALWGPSATAGLTPLSNGPGGNPIYSVTAAQNAYNQKIAAQNGVNAAGNAGGANSDNGAAAAGTLAAGGSGLNSSVTSAQGLNSQTQADANAVYQEMQNALNGLSPASQTALGQNTLNQYSANLMSQMQTAYQNNLAQLASQGIAQGGAPQATYNNLLSQVLGNTANEQSTLANDVLQNQTQNALAQGTLGNEALNAANLPYQQLMSLAGLQDTATNQSGALSGGLANTDYGLMSQLMSALTGAYSSSSQLGTYQQLLNSIPSLLASYLGNGSLTGLSSMGY